MSKDNGAGWFTSKEAETFPITSPTGETGTVQLRKLNEGDKQDRENELMKMRAAKGQKGAQTISYALGALRRFDMRRAIVGWSLPGAPDDQAFRALDPSVAEQIHTKIREMNPFIFDEGDDDESPVPTPEVTEA